MFPFHIFYLVVFKRQSLPALWGGLRRALEEHVTPSRFDRLSTFPRWGFIRLVVILTITMSVPALLWFIAVALAP